MNIKHNPLFKTDELERIYTEKDGVPVKYVCTSELPIASNVSMDIFYRATPHPEFGNRYFGVYYDERRGSPMITNADSIDGADFAMINVDNEWHYSSYRHDYKGFKDSNDIYHSIDGGRAYTRGNNFVFFKIENGEIVRNPFVADE